MLGVSHAVVARYQLGIQLSESPVGLDVQDASVVWLAIDVACSLVAQLRLSTCLSSMMEIDCYNGVWLLPENSPFKRAGKKLYALFSLEGHITYTLFYWLKQS